VLKLNSDASRATTAQRLNNKIIKSSILLFKRRLWLLLLFMPIQTGVATEVAADAAVDVVAHFQSELLSVMRDATALGFEGRFARLVPAVRQSHDLTRVARLTIGRRWRSLDTQQKARFVDTFTRLVITTYAHQFHAYSGESFNSKSVKSLKRGRKLVSTELIKSNGKRVHLDYVLNYRQGRWLIINIIADGVSDLALKRAEYSNDIKRNGFEHLLSVLEGKIAQYK